MNLNDFSRAIQKRNISKFANFLETPAEGTIKLPANGRFAILSISGNEANAEACEVVGVVTKTLSVGELVAGQYQVVDNIEFDSVVTIKPGFNLLLDVGLSEFKVICTES